MGFRAVLMVWPCLYTPGLPKAVKWLYMGLCGLLYMENVKTARNCLKCDRHGDTVYIALQTGQTRRTSSRRSRTASRRGCCPPCVCSVFVVWRTNPPKMGTNGLPPSVRSIPWAWGVVYILKAFYFCQKGKVHLLNIQTAKLSSEVSS